ncbi:MAG TPA: hypothetical protein VKA46_34595 [Gemmataceae bacterium]|nr:hypothetical protein [Gemmataceae bacterium]
MTLLTPNDSRLISRIRLTGEGRWVSLSLSLGELAPTTRFLAISERLLYEMAGLDEVAQKYGLSNWQGGIISGARYAFRALKAPPQQVCIHELRGQLGSGDIWAVSSAAALAVARLLARPPAFPVDLAGWKMEEEVWRPRSLEAEATSQGAEVAPSPPEPREGPAENLPPASPKTGRKGDTQDLPTEPGAVGERKGAGVNDSSGASK